MGPALEVHANCPGNTLAEQLKNPKTLPGWKARGACRGVEIYLTDDDCDGQPLIVGCKWAMTRHMRTAEEVEKFLAQVGA